MVAGRDDPEGLRMMLDIAEKKLDEPRPICWVPHVLNGDQWEAWLPEPDHPQYERFRLLKLRHEVHEYGEQKELLDKLHQQTRQDVFVANVLVMSKEGEPTLTIASWAKGITSWLPRTDQIGFFEPETKALRRVPWERAQRTVGDLMEPVDVFPPRWEVSGFPTEEQFAVMGAGFA
jgi:hypothetical protein